MNNETKYPTYGIWLNALEAITRAEMGLDLADLPDVLTLDDYQAGIDPEDAFAAYITNVWDDFAPFDAPTDLEEAFDQAMRRADREEEEPGSDADPGL